ncbi:MAG: thioredoxin domain-containing protein [Proteobacteria bacterium]|nr:thioredoxin domain-containing protein [Pseudomonadota bacterium]
MKNFVSVVLLSIVLFISSSQADEGIRWINKFDKSTFKQAQQEKKLLILNLEAVWCHWCHVMAESTYSDKRIIELVNNKYLPLKVDQDARPDLSNRYRDYGWPATIIFNSQGEELEKLTGYVEPDEMYNILQESLKNPFPKKEAVSKTVVSVVGSGLDTSLKETLLSKYRKAIDTEKGGLKTGHRYIDSDTLEYAIKLAAKEDKDLEQFAKLTLRENENLLDKEWGGVYQYSVRSVWTRPHYEKIAEKQADNIKIYSLAYSLWNDDKYRIFIEKVYQYLSGFLQNQEGAFYVSQDADLVRGQHSDDYFMLSDQERRKKGIPVIDTNVYSNENGKIISSLTYAYAATGESKYLDAAIKATNWILANRVLEDTAEVLSFKHGEKDKKSLYLCDNLFMANAMLRLYAVTGNRDWLVRAKKATAFMLNNFKTSDDLGYYTAIDEESLLPPKALISENIAVVRLLAPLAHYTGEEKYKNAAKPALNLLSIKELSLENISEIGVVLADEELNNPPTHLTIVAAKADETGKKLFAEALKYPASYKRTEWWDKSEGTMPNADVQYPTFPKAAAYVCTNKRCSLPIFKVEDLVPTIKRLSSR